MGRSTQVGVAHLHTKDCGDRSVGAVYGVTKMNAAESTEHNA